MYHNVIGTPMNINPCEFNDTSSTDWKIPAKSQYGGHFFIALLVMIGLWTHITISSQPWSSVFRYCYENTQPIYEFL